VTTELDLPLVVYRGWQLDNDRKRRGLFGMYRATSEWGRGDTLAACEDCGDDCPGEDCQCGLHGWCVLPGTWSNTNWATHTSLTEVFRYTPRIVFGAALLWGHMRIGMQTGTVRAEHGCVLALLNMGEEARKTATAYHVPIIADEHLLRSYALEHGQETGIPKEL
jgi:hypothetical protein